MIQRTGFARGSRILTAHIIFIHGRKSPSKIDCVRMQGDGYHCLIGQTVAKVESNVRMKGY